MIINNGDIRLPIPPELLVPSPVDDVPPLTIIMVEKISLKEETKSEVEELASVLSVGS